MFSVRVGALQAECRMIQISTNAHYVKNIRVSKEIT